jgi:rhodanese-related sulfurtransferase
MPQIQNISVQELAKMRKEKIPHQLIDVREAHEFEFCHIDGLLIPLGEIESRSAEVNRNQKVVVQCRSGQRSATAIALLEQQGFTNLHNLTGGILAWSDEIDHNIPKY